MVRIAHEKYKRFGEAKTYAEAFLKLLNNNIYPFNYADEWQVFRE